MVMARVTVEDCLDNVDNRFELVMLAAKRARQMAIGGKDRRGATDAAMAGLTVPLTEEFVQQCRREVPTDAAGTRHRNHCPLCLWSIHVDERPGDRKSACNGGMEPIAIWVRDGSEWALVHRCGTCHAVRVNRIAGDDNEAALLSLAAQPMARPPFPVDKL